MIKASKYNLKKLEELFHDLDYKIRYEKGNFNSGYCIVEQKKVIVINKFYDTEARFNVLQDILFLTDVLVERLSEKSLSFFNQILKEQQKILEKD